MNLRTHNTFQSGILYPNDIINYKMYLLGEYNLLSNHIQTLEKTYCKWGNMVWGA